MNHDEVMRLACKVAGLKELDDPVLGMMFNTGFTTILIKDPALPAYVAELLVRKARPRDVGDVGSAILQLSEYENFDHDMVFDLLMAAPANFRILAALVALGKLTPEEAQEREIAKLRAENARILRQTDETVRALHREATEFKRERDECAQRLEQAQKVE